MTRRRCIECGLAVLIALRCGLGPYRELAGLPDALFFPPQFLGWLSGMPPLGVIVVAQVVGVAAAAASLRRGRHRRVAFALAWLALLLLAGLRTSLGKILHNDVLLLLAAVPFVLLAESDDDDRWAVRVATVVVAGAYFFAGYQKLVHTGLEWAFSDNMRWILYAGARSGKPHVPEAARFVADRAWLATASAAGLLGVELAFPLAVVWGRARVVFVGLVAGVHALTWLTLGLDYWMWVAVVALVLVDWPAVVARAPRRAVVPAARTV